MAAASLNTCTVLKSRAIVGRIHMFLHFIAVLTLLYYRISHLFLGDVPFISWGLLTTSELILTLAWIVTQSFRWRPVERSVRPENLPADKELPAVDVFICTADPKKEPVVEVMNTVVSAMALDYPPEKLAVYLSDDGGAPVTLCAIRNACSFAKEWVPFCRKYGIKTICPEAYFSSSLGADERMLRDDAFKAEEEILKSAYELFKRDVEKAVAIDDSTQPDRPAYVEVIHDNGDNQSTEGDLNKLPLLVYLSRERRPTRPHRFKAGALNALLRVSGIMSNAPYLIVLDCDMYCNDPSSAKQAMCFHLDPQLSPSLSYVQYPQIFYNVSKNDIYDGQARSAYKTKYQGMDGIRGTVCSGTSYYLKKKTLYCSYDEQDDLLEGAEKKFGCSSKFIESLKGVDAQSVNKKGVITDAIIEEAKNLASCSYEENTKWGDKVGYSYKSLLESSFTGYLLHCNGWRSVYLYPKRPCFLGCVTIDMKDALIQMMKWASGLLQVCLSRFSPFTYGLSRMPLLQAMCYGYFMFVHACCVACLIYGIVVPLSFSKGIPLYPKVSSQWFGSFAIVFLSSLGQHLYEVISSGGSVKTCWNEQRIWIIKTVTGCLFGFLDAVMKSLGIGKANFRLTNKAVDEEKLKKYENGRFDFQGAKIFMIPLTLLAVFNLVCFFGGMRRMIIDKSFEEMFGQAFFCTFITLLSYPILEGLVSKIKG